MQVTLYIYSSVYSYKYLFLYIKSSLSNQTLKDDAVKVLHSICQQIEKLNSGHRTRKGQFSFQSKRKVIKKKNVQTTAQLHSIHMLTK